MSKRRFSIYRAWNLPKQQAGQHVARWLKAGFIGVPEYLPGKIPEGYSIKLEEAGTKLKDGKARVGSV